jgi:hypothetical protein
MKRTVGNGPSCDHIPSPPDRTSRAGDVEQSGEEEVDLHGRKAVQESGDAVEQSKTLTMTTKILIF